MSSAEEPQDRKESKSTGEAIAAAFRELGDTFRGLLTAPRALWGINLSYLLEGLAYFGVLTILGKYLSEDVALSDLHAGWVYSLFTGGITLAMLVLGGVSDKIGVRRALLISLGLMVLGRVALGASGTFFAYGQGAGSAMFWTVLVGLFLIVIGYGMYQPAAYAGVKKYTNKKNAAIGFAMIYALMNLGAFFSGLMSPPIRQEHGMVGVYWTFVVITILAFLAVLFILTRRTAVLAKERVQRENEAFAKSAAEAPPARERPQVRSLRDPLTIVLGLVFAGCAVSAIALAISAPLPPLEQAAAANQAFLEGGGAALATESSARSWAADLQRRGQALDAALDPQAAQATAPAGATVDKLAIGVVALKRQSDQRQLTALLSQAGLFEQATLEAARAQRIHDGLRAHGVRSMAAAYALAAGVDSEVVAGLQLRLKRADEERVPLDAAARQQIIVDSALAPAGMLLAHAKACRELAESIWAAGHDPRSMVLADTLVADATFAQTLSPDWAAGDSPLARQILSAKLLYDALGYKQMAEALFSHGPEGPVPTEVRAATLAQQRLANAAGFFENMKEELPRTVARPTAERLRDWSMRYGLFLIPGFLALLGLIWRQLRLRPDHPFHNSRFTFFIFILIPVQTLFAHNWLTLPYYINRAFGGTTVGDNFEFFSNINPLLIFFLTPLVAALTARARVYPMMIWGTLVMAAPTFLLALPPSPFMLITYILLMSVGEAMWQPRFLQLIAEIAPEGQVGAYMGIGQLPWFMTKVVTGMYSGWFLAQYCPQVGPQNTEFMWLIYGFIAMASPVALWLAKGWVGARIEERHT